MQVIQGGVILLYNEIPLKPFSVRQGSILTVYISLSIYMSIFIVNLHKFVENLK